MIPNKLWLYTLFQNCGNTTFLLYLCLSSLFASIQLDNLKELLPWSKALRANYHKDKRKLKVDANLE